MESRFDVLTLISKKESFEKKLKALVYGAIEVREREDKKYIYVHYRQDGIARTKYVGEFSDDLYNLVLGNNIKAKATKKELKTVIKELKALGYVESEISEKVALNVDFAKSHMVDTIYNQAVLEGVATTYSDTETIIEGGKVNNMTADDVLKIINLKHAWEFVLNKDVISSPTNFALLCEINKLVEEGFYYNAGIVRSIPVGIGGTTWKPEIPIESALKEQLSEILNASLSIADKSIELLLYVMKKQIFIDGNKRTAVICANHFMISNAKGLIVIPNDKVNEYKKLLIAYYEGNDGKSIKAFLKNQCYMQM